MKARTAALRLLAIAFGGVMSMSASAGRGQSATYYVATYGSDTSGNGSLTMPWATIEHALGAVPDGSTILVRPGTYTGRVRLQRVCALGCTIRSEVPYQAAWRNNDQVVTSFGATSPASGITFDGFDVAHLPGTRNPIVFHIDGGGNRAVHDIVIQNNVIHDSYDNDLLKINNSAVNITVQGNMFYNQTGSDEHIDVNSEEFVTVQDNVFFNDFEGSGRVNDSSTSSFIVIKDSNGKQDAYLGSRNITVRRNVFLHWQRTGGHNFVLCGEDGTRNFEAFGVLVENNLMLGNSPFGMRSPFGVKGCKDVTFRNNTVSGDLPAVSYAFRLNDEKQNPPNQNILMYNNVWADPTGTMNRFSDTPIGQTSSFVLSNNVYWNGGAPIPTNSADLINYTDDAARRVADPLLSNPGGAPTPRWTPPTGTFADGSTTIRQAFLRLVDTFGRAGRPPERVHEAQEGLADGRRAVGEGPRGRGPAGRGRAAGVAEQRVGHAAGRVVRVVDEVRAVRGDGRAPVPVHVVAQHEGRRLADGGVREAVHGPRGIGPYVVVERDVLVGGVLLLVVEAEGVGHRGQVAAHGVVAEGHVLAALDPEGRPHAERRVAQHEVVLDEHAEGLEVARPVLAAQDEVVAARALPVQEHVAPHGDVAAAQVGVLLAVAVLDHDEAAGAAVVHPPAALEVVEEHVVLDGDELLAVHVDVLVGAGLVVEHVALHGDVHRRVVDLEEVVVVAVVDHVVLDHDVVHGPVP